MKNLKTAMMISGGIGIGGVCAVAAGLGGFFGWPGALIGVGAALLCCAVLADKLIEETRRERLKAAADDPARAASEQKMGETK